MARVVSCSRIAFNGLSRESKPVMRVSVVSKVAALPPARHISRRAYSTSNVVSPLNAVGASNGEGSAQLASHLDSIFSPLKFPPELANRILTHSSHRDAAVSNNTRLSFIGRRVLSSYLMLFLHSAPSLQSSHEYELIAQRTLNTYVLGEHVSPKWGLGRVLKWSPVKVDPEVDHVAGDFSKLSPKILRTVGLYKVQGSAVEAVIGGIYHQFGGDLAHRIFHTRLLPHVLLPGAPVGLNDAFHAHALEICDRMGGSVGTLAVENGSGSKGVSSSTPPVSSMATP